MKMLKAPETSFGRLTLVVAVLAAVAGGTYHFFFSGGHGGLEGPKFWLQEGWADDSRVVEIVAGPLQQKPEPLLPARCYSDVLPIFSTTPLDPECVPLARSACSEGYTERFMDGRIVEDHLVCRIESGPPNADKQLPFWTEVQIILHYVSAYSWSAINAWGPSFLAALLSAATAWLSLVVARGVWFWVTAG